MKNFTVIFTKKSFIAFLLFISVLLTSSTFAYWADTVVGSESEITASFVVGSPIYDDHDFVLTSSINTYSYLIPTSYLLENPTVTTDNVSVGIMWNDQALKDTYTEEDLANLTVSYELVLLQDGKEVNRNLYDQFTSLFDITMSELPTEISYGALPTTVNLDITLTPENQSNDYSHLLKYEAYIVVTFSINE
jgi:hypothetical protein